MSYPISLDPYWVKIIDYYYDHIYWEKNAPYPAPSIAEWLFKEYSATLIYDDRLFHFETEAKKTWFILRWT